MDELDAAGVNVCIGHDSIMDPWYPMGKGSMLAAANLLLHTAHMSGYDQIFRLFDMITVNSARTMNVEERYGIEPGKPANLLVLDRPGPVRGHTAPERVSLVGTERLCDRRNGAGSADSELGREEAARRFFRLLQRCRRGRGSPSGASAEDGLKNTVHRRCLLKVKCGASGPRLFLYSIVL